VHLQVVQEAHQVCEQAVRRFEGYLAQHFGTGFVVYFGYPSAHEDDARRAVHTGLEMVQGIQRLAPLFGALSRLQVMVEKCCPHPTLHKHVYTTFAVA
jgi:class 3 adenylate cyclase